MWNPSQQIPGDSGKLLRFSLILAVVLMSLWFAVTLTTNPAKDHSVQSMRFDRAVTASGATELTAADAGDSGHGARKNGINKAGMDENGNDLTGMASMDSAVYAGSNPEVDPVIVAMNAPEYSGNRLSGLGRPDQNPSKSTADESPGHFGTAGLIMAFILMAGLLGAGFWAYRKHSPETRAAKSAVRVRENTQIAAGHQITLVEINNEVWVLGLSGTQMTLLHRYEDGEWTPDGSKDRTLQGAADRSFAGSKITDNAAFRSKISDTERTETVVAGSGLKSEGNSFYMDLIRNNGF